MSAQYQEFNSSPTNSEIGGPLSPTSNINNLGEMLPFVYSTTDSDFDGGVIINWQKRYMTLLQSFNDVSSVLQEEAANFHSFKKKEQKKYATLETHYLALVHQLEEKIKGLENDERQKNAEIEKMKIIIEDLKQDPKFCRKTMEGYIPASPSGCGREKMKNYLFVKRQ